MFSATVFLLLGSAGKPISQSKNLPSFRDFHRRIWADEVNLAEDDMKIDYGRVHWEQLLQSAREARFDEALGIVSERNTTQQGVRLPLPSAPLKGSKLRQSSDGADLLAVLADLSEVTALGL